MKYILILCSALLAGCEHNPARPEWPKDPNVGACTELDNAMPSEKLSDLLVTVTKNYGKYHECAARTQAWQEWYTEQKRIYQESK